MLKNTENFSVSPLNIVTVLCFLAIYVSMVTGAREMRETGPARVVHSQKSYIENSKQDKSVD